MRFQRLASRLLFGDPRLRSPEAVLRNRRGQPELWKYGISGDLPIVLATIEDGSQLPLLTDLLKAHEYLRGKGMAFDLVVLNAHATTYRMDLQDTVQQMVESGPEQAWIDRPGGVFLRRTDLIPAEDQLLLRATARAVMDGAEGGLAQQLVRPEASHARLPEPIRVTPASPDGRGGRAERRPSRTSSRSTASGDLPPTGASTSSACIPTRARFRPSPGSTSSPTRRSGSPRPTSAPDSPGPATATTTG